MKNPLTNLPIRDFSIYKSSECGSRFRFYANKKEILKNCNFFPIVWSHPDCSVQNQIALMLRYADAHREVDPQKSIKTYEKAHKIGSLDARVGLFEVHKKLGDTDKSLFWAERTVNQVDNPSLQNIFFCASEFRKAGR